MIGGESRACMLKLTTGDQPSAPGSDGMQAFAQRLQAAFVSEYQRGQLAEGDGQVYPKLVIIGQSEGKLEIYNPWGSTGWVTTEQSVSNDLGSVTEGEMPVAFRVGLPLSSPDP